MTSDDYIAQAIGALALRAVPLAGDAARAVQGRASVAFGVDFRRLFPWDAPGASSSVQCEDGWQLIRGFVGPAACLLWSSDTDRVWELQGGDDLLKILSACPAFEFYVCDADASYLICFNHHDFLIGWGAAARWVESLEI